ncbi:ABC transporter ATP-binding protein [Streptomyces sp. NPDC049577]|uniref:ABC transporter ATP-binding protein n=1 Tax=Streptomyces sp. NPDC049577 TaxID=3155153 RepID=UPI0034270869
MTTVEKNPGTNGADAAKTKKAPLLEVRDLHVEFKTDQGVAKAVNGVSYTVDAGETLAVLGESGSGKSVTAQAIMGILDMPPGRIPSGEIFFHGQDILKLGEEERRKLRGAKMAMIFQDALSALNPVHSVGAQIGEMFRVHKGMSKADAKAKAVELMDRVRIPAAKQRVNDYPHQFSGGMRQRIMIAMALALEPELIIADEPTTALDVTVQAQVMDLLAELQREYNMGLILITHDLGVVADVADKIAVMYAGRIVETSPVHDIYKRPAHPYSKGLLDSIPRLDHKGQELYAIKGLPPNLLAIPPGCAFSPRCSRAQDLCRTDVPALHQVTERDGAELAGRGSACHFWKETIHG